MTPTHDSANAPTAGVSPLESLKLVVSLVAVLFGASLFYGNHLDGAVSSSVIAEVMDSPNECLKSAVKNDLTKHQDAPITRRNLGEHERQCDALEAQFNRRDREKAAANAQREAMSTPVPR
jgi:hypothetical protein